MSTAVAPPIQFDDDEAMETVHVNDVTDGDAGADANPATLEDAAAPEQSTAAAGERPLSTLSIVYIALLVVMLIAQFTLARRKTVATATLLFFFPSALLFFLTHRAVTLRKILPLSKKIEAFGIGMFLYGPLLNIVVGFITYAITDYLAHALTTMTGEVDIEINMLRATVIVLIIVTVEELAKFAYTRRAVTKGDTHSNPKTFVLTVLFLSAGYATCQCFLWFFVIFMWEYGDVPLDILLMEVYMTASFVVPMHLLSAYSIGLGVGKRYTLQKPTSMLSIIVPPVFFRSLYIVMVVGPIFIETDASGIACTIVSMIAAVAFVLYVKRQEKQLPPNYLARTGYLSALGYGALPDVDIVAESNPMEDGDGGELGSDLGPTHLSAYNDP
jgi:hypothetical protein